MIRVHEELEKKVEERTARLSKANEILNTEIAERVHSEYLLNHSQTVLRAIFDGIADPLVLLDEGSLDLN